MGERTESIHMGVDGQWILNINLSSSKEVFVNELHNFTIIEETGNLLPTWKISFTASPQLEPEWTESLQLPLVISKSQSSSEKLSTTLHILHPEVKSSQDGDNIKQYNASGILYAPAFTQTPYCTTTKNCHGTDVLQSIAKKHFKEVDTSGMTVSSEKQIWVQPNTTDMKFLDYVAPRCFINNSFTGTGITSGGKYVITDVVKASNNKEKWKIGDSDSNSLTILSGPKAVSNSAFMNSVGGYGMDTPIISQDGGFRSVHRPSIKFGFTKNEHPQINNVQRKTLAPVICSMSNDPKTLMAKANADYGQALLCMESVEVTLEAPFFPIQIWDVVSLQSPDKLTGGLNINQSGKYIVSKVSRTVKNYRLYTSLVLNRDAHNQSSQNK